MSKFAKLFEFEDLGQVLVKLDDGDDGPEVRTYFVPDGFGVCSIAMTFKSDEHTLSMQVQYLRVSHKFQSEFKGIA